VETRREPAATRPGDAAPAERPSAPDPPNPQNPPEPTRGPRGSEDPGAVIDWLLNEGRRH
jgi:hypothetical protein